MKYSRRLTSGIALVVSLAGGQAEAQLTAGAPADNFTLTNWVTGAQEPTDVAFLVDGRAVVIQKGGTIMVRRANGTMNNNAGNVALNTGGQGEQGLLSVVALVNYRDRPTNTDRDRTIFLYASVDNNAANRHKVLKAIVNANDTVTVDTANPIVSMGLNGPANHNGGGMNLYKNQLYIGVGDTGANSTPPTNKFASCLNRANGKILRVNIDGTIPADNPLVGMATVTGCDSTGGAFGDRAPDTRIYAWGLRNPWRNWVDPITGLLWVGDVGEGAREEISIGTKGTHFGYPFEEGDVKYSQAFNMNGCMGIKPATPCQPVAHNYDHGNGNNCVTGGLIANEDGRLCGWPDAFKNRYFFADHGSGRMWTLTVNADRRGASAASQNFAQIGNPASIRMGFDDAMYVASRGSNAIIKIAPRNRDAAMCAAQAMNQGGAGGSAAGGSAGNPGTGGSAGRGGAGTGGSANGGSSSQGGAPSGSGGTSGDGGNAAGESGQAGEPGQGGGSDQGGGGGDDPGSSSGSSGCGCRLSSNADTGGGALLVLGAALWFTVRRRRATARPR